MRKPKTRDKTLNSRRDRNTPAEPASALAQSSQKPAWYWIALIAACVIIFYWIPVTSSRASIQWDAADMHYPLQRYFSEHIRAGQMPFWTPYIFSGYPLLANPEMAAFYPPHWLFYLFGVAPRSIQWELALHAFLACCGAWFLIMRLVPNRSAALLGAFAYGLSGFFAGHSSHVGLFSAAADLPWLLLFFDCAVEAQAPLFVALGGLAGGMIILAGYLQTALYAFAAMVLYAIASVYMAPRRWLRIGTIVIGILAVASAAAAVQIFPTLELAANSIRAAYDFSRSSEGSLHLSALATLLAPNALGAIEGPYAGPPDITQYYFYAGFLVVPLAAIGLAKAKTRVAVLILILPTIWYMLGPSAGLYRLGGILPGFGKVRAPIQGWFVVALGVAILAAAGFSWILERWTWRFLAPVIIALVFVDLWYWNSLVNPLAYARSSFEELYGNAEQATGLQIAATVPPLSRVDAPRALTAFGPLDHPLDLHMETTYGYFALELAPYDDYTNAMQTNSKLRDGLNVGQVFSLQEGRLESNPTMLPRAYFPKVVTDVDSAPAARAALPTLNPAFRSIVLRPHPEFHQDPAAAVSITFHDEQSMRLHYRAASASLLRLSVPNFPGWRAEIAGNECPVTTVDHALLGVIVPPGEHDLDVRFHSTYFPAGVATSIAGVLFASCLIVYSAYSHRKRAEPSLQQL
jgi:hypothetical protein